MVKVVKTITVESEAWEFVARELDKTCIDRRGGMSSFINEFIESEAKRRGLMGGYVNVFTPTAGAAPVEDMPETPQQVWKRIEGEVNYVRSCIEAGKEDNPNYTIEAFPFLFEYANKCKMSRAEFSKWVNGDYKEIEMAVNVDGK